MKSQRGTGNRERKPSTGKSRTSGDFGSQGQKTELQPHKAWEGQLNQRREDRSAGMDAFKTGVKKDFVLNYRGERQLTCS